MTEIGVGVVYPHPGCEITSATQEAREFYEWLDRLEIPPGKSLDDMLREEQEKREQSK